MADRKITVLNPAGYQELLQSGDSLLVDGDINLQTNGLTGVPSPTLNVDAANKSYVDTGDNTNATAITSLDSRLTNVETDVGNITIPTVNNATVTVTGGSGVNVTGGTFTLNQSADVNLSIEVPAISNALAAPSTDGDFIVTTTSGVTTYSETIDLGSY